MTFTSIFDNLPVLATNSLLWHNGGDYISLYGLFDVVAVNEQRFLSISLYQFLTHYPYRHTRVGDATQRVLDKCMRNTATRSGTAEKQYLLNVQ